MTLHLVDGNLAFVFSVGLNRLQFNLHFTESLLALAIILMP